MFKSFADVSGPYSGGNAYDMINPHQRPAGGGSDPVGPDTAQAQDAISGGNPVGVIIGMLGALVVLGFIINSSASLAGKAGVLLTPVFWMMNILGVMVGIVCVKLFLTRFPIPGLTPVVAIV